MDIWRLDSSRSADELVQNLTTKIWTERYQDAGEFELRSNKIAYIRDLLPEGTLLGERNSQEVMIVETHDISDTEDGPEIVTRGRTFETFTEQRATVVVQATPGRTAMWTYGADDVYPTDAAKALLMSHVTVSTEDTKQKVSNTSVENLIGAHTVETLSYAHEAGELYSEIINLLQMENAGIRNQIDATGKLFMYIYKGVDRTVNQSTNDPVIFSVPAEYMTDAKYLFSIKDFKNVAYVVGEFWQQIVYAPGVDPSVSGLDRRILVVDGSEIKDEDGTAKKTRQAKALGLAALAKHNQTKFVDGEVSPKSPYIRGVDYNLGDMVTLMGNYGVSQTMMVNEYVRAEDQQGERAYPTLISV